MSCLLFHPSLAPFVVQAARALDEQGDLTRLVTTLSERSFLPMRKVLRGVAPKWGVTLDEKLGRRALEGILPGQVTHWPWGEILRLSLGSLSRTRRLEDWIWERAEHAFDWQVARIISSKLRAVYGYEHASLATFRRAGELGLKVIYDMPAPESGVVEESLFQELEAYPELRTTWHEWTRRREPRRRARRREEFDLADVVVVASNYSRETFRQAGWDISRMVVVPYGSPPVMDRDAAVQGGSRMAGPVRFLWAGTFGIRKGAHYLLEAWRNAGLQGKAQLDIYGSVDLPEQVLKPLPDGVVMHGPVNRELLWQAMEQSDLLLFPTLSDGFGMVATEAWSRGLPVLTTSSAGASDLLRDGENGMLVKSADAAALCEKLIDCVQHREPLREMRLPAWQTARDWQWQDYRMLLREKLKSCLC